MNFASHDGTMVFSFDGNDDGTTRYQSVDTVTGASMDIVLKVGYDTIKLARSCYGLTFLPEDILKAIEKERK